MADIIDQDEIESLLQSIETPSSDDVDVSKVDTDTTKTSKIFKPRKTDICKFIYPYRSPVIKREKVVYNPSGDVPNGMIAVRSLGNYNLYNQKKHQ